MRGFGGEAPEKKIIILGTERNFQVLDWVLDWVLDARTSGTGKGGYWVWMPGRRVPVRGGTGYWVLSSRALTTANPRVLGFEYRISEYRSGGVLGTEY